MGVMEIFFSESLAIHPAASHIVEIFISFRQAMLMKTDDDNLGLLLVSLKPDWSHLAIKA
jgi:hypothetical protein